MPTLDDLEPGRSNDCETAPEIPPGDMTLPAHVHLMLHLAALVSVAALLFRDQIKLRAVLLVSIALALANNYDGSDATDWEDLFWNAVLFTINLVVLVQLVLDRTHIGLSAEERSLFDAFGLLTPGEFRALARLASWHTAGGGEAITCEGEAPGALFYVLTGGLTIEKGERTIPYGPGTFIGEIAFIKRGTASATVRLDAGSRYVAWATAGLDRRIAGRQELRHAVTRLISHDMALKVGRA